MWKRDYLNLGAGGETDIYKKFKGEFWMVRIENSMKMSFQLKKD